MTELPEEPERSNRAPLGLDYFAVHEPDRRRSRAVGFWSICLALAWVPYLCGIVNAFVVARSYSPAVTRSHNVGAIMFLGLGLVLSVTALAGFIRWRHWPGIVAGLLLFGVQASVAACLGVSNF